MIDCKLDSAAQTLCLGFPGDIFSTNAEDLREEVLHHLETDPVKAAQWDCLHLNLTRARMIDSHGFDFLIQLCKMMEARSVKMTAAVSSPLIRRNFALLRLDKLVAVELTARPARHPENPPKEKP